MKSVSCCSNVRYAIARRHLNCLHSLSDALENYTEWDVTETMFAAMVGDLSLLKFLHEHGCPWDAQTTEGAAGNGKLDCLIYAHEHGCPWTSGTIRVSAENTTKEKIACLTYAIANGCPFT